MIFCVLCFPYSCVLIHRCLCECILTPCFLSCLAWPYDCKIAVSTGYRVSSSSQVEARSDCDTWEEVLESRMFATLFLKLVYFILKEVTMFHLYNNF